MTLHELFEQSKDDPMGILLGPFACHSVSIFFACIVYIYMYT